MRDSLEEVIQGTEVVVIANGSPGFRRVPELLREGQFLIDLVGMAKGSTNRGNYEGICW